MGIRIILPKRACAWVNQGYALIQKGISLHIPYGGKLLSRGTERDYDRAADAYLHAKLQLNARAMFNLGYMHGHGQGLPLDLHLANHYYDQALKTDSAAKFPISTLVFDQTKKMNEDYMFTQTRKPLELNDKHIRELMVSLFYIVSERAHMVGYNPSRTPVDTESKLGDGGTPVVDPTLYQSLADADWAGCPTTRRSTLGYCVFLGNNLLSWSSKRQPMLSRSIAEAEYRGGVNDVAETCGSRIYFMSFILLYLLLVLCIVI
nr:ERAD-associated E3 ubiquitin-protein ligase component HRD3A-like [Tanacetum cinerariifolium]